jgi:hypothetical protein
MIGLDLGELHRQRVQTSQPRDRPDSKKPRTVDPGLGRIIR